MEIKDDKCTPNETAAWKETLFYGILIQGSRKRLRAAERAGFWKAPKMPTLKKRDVGKNIRVRGGGHRRENKCFAMRRIQSGILLIFANIILYLLSNKIWNCTKATWRSTYASVRVNFKPIPIWIVTFFKLFRTVVDCNNECFVILMGF